MNWCHGNRNSIRYDGFRFYWIGLRGGVIRCHSPYQVQNGLEFDVCRECGIVKQAELWIGKFVTRSQCEVFGFEYRFTSQKV